MTATEIDTHLTRIIRQIQTYGQIQHLATDWHSWETPGQLRVALLQYGDQQAVLTVANDGWVGLSMLGDKSEDWVHPMISPNDPNWTAEVCHDGYHESWLNVQDPTIPHRIARVILSGGMWSCLLSD